MPNLEEIQALLDKYWLGETTLEEERSLKTYFAASLVDERFRPLIPLFRTLRQEQAVRLEGSKKVSMPARRSGWSHWAVAAAIAALLAVGGWWMFGPQRNDNMAATPPQLVPKAPIPMYVPPATPAPTPVPALAEQPVPVKKVAVKRKKLAPAALDPEAELAMEEIKAALALVSSKLNKGKKAAIKDLNQLENVDKFIKPKSDS